MDKRWCSSCGETFEPRAQSPRQAFCKKAACQLVRKRLWQRAKRNSDVDYRENQAAAQEFWRQKHPDYWRRYREDHPEYAASNRERQKVRNARRTGSGGGVAKGDVSEDSIPSGGIFQLTLVEPPHRGPRRQWTVRLTILTER